MHGLTPALDILKCDNGYLCTMRARQTVNQLSYPTLEVNSKERQKVRGTREKGEGGKKWCQQRKKSSAESGEHQLKSIEAVPNSGEGGRV